jgi:hypothetical protein
VDHGGSGGAGSVYCVYRPMLVILRQLASTV